MGACCSKTSSVGLPSEPAAGDELAEFERLLGEGVEPGSGWVVKRDWPRSPLAYPDDFRLRVCVRPHESGNPNLLMRADAAFRGVKPEHFLEFLLNPAAMPGLKELADLEGEPPKAGASGTCIKYLRVKAPGMRPRDHVWRYVIDRRAADGSIFVCIRTVTHPARPEVAGGPIRAYYYNATRLRMGIDTAGVPVCELTEFIFQDLKGGIPTCLMNAALAPGTLAFNQAEMRHFKDAGLFTAPGSK